MAGEDRRGVCPCWGEGAAAQGPPASPQEGAAWAPYPPLQHGISAGHLQKNRATLRKTELNKQQQEHSEVIGKVKEKHTERFVMWILFPSQASNLVKDGNAEELPEGKRSVIPTTDSREKQYTL